MMTYTILDNIDMDILAANVQNMIKLGWRPQGGVSIVWRPYGDSSYMLFTQAMIKPALSWFQQFREWWTRP